MVTACVTGASGYIALHLVKDLLEAGHTVNGTVRDKDNEAKTATVRSLPGADERLALFSADLVGAPGSFDEAVSGCEYVFHVASPYMTNVKDPEKQLIRPAVDGVKSVIESCAKAGPTLKRLILTSSMAAITDEAIDGYVFTEEDYNTKSNLNRNPYYHSKYLSEKFAHDFMETEKPSFELIVINPFIVLGPAIGTSPGESAEQVILAALKGDLMSQLPLYLGLVDVRDVSKAHVLAMTQGNPGNRYLCAGDNVEHRDFMNYLIELGYCKENGFKVPATMAGGFTVSLIKLLTYIPGIIPKDMGTFMRLQLGKTLAYDNSKIKKDLGFEFRPWKETVSDTLAELQKSGHIKTPPPAQETAAE